MTAPVTEPARTNTASILAKKSHLALPMPSASFQITWRSADVQNPCLLEIHSLTASQPFEIPSLNVELMAIVLQSWLASTTLARILAPFLRRVLEHPDATFWTRCQ